MLIDLVKEIEVYFHTRKSVSIITHKRPDGDAIGSALALCHFLKESGVQSEIIIDDRVPQSLDFLPGVDSIRFRKLRDDTDLFVILDLGAEDLIGEELLKGVIYHIKIHGTPALLIDHHSSDTRFDKIELSTSFVDRGRSSTAEVLLELLLALGATISPNIAQCLLAGIVFDTRGFRTADTKLPTLKAITTLVESGASLYEVMRAYESQFSWEGFSLHTLTRLKAHHDGILVWSSVTRDMFASTNTTQEDLTNLAADFLSIRGVKVSLLFIERDDGSVKISGRATLGITLLPLARADDQNGGGHKGAVGFSLFGSIDTVIEKVIRRFWELYPNILCDGLSSSSDEIS